MKVSVFTPTNDSKFLPQIYECLKGQTYKDWDWNIVYNNGGVPIDFKDPRVKTQYLYKSPEWVGPLKSIACENSTGDILLELDHDDLLTPDAIEDVVDGFKDPEVGFVYSNTIHCMGDFTKVQRFDEKFGWKFREVKFQGHDLDEHISFDPTPDSISRIWYAPNHVRAFRRDSYYRAGGYDRTMRILDDLDLMSRMYQVTKFKHIDKGLYVYRVHGENTWLRYNKEIQDNVYRIYDKYIESLAKRWAEINGLRKLDLGGRISDIMPVGYESVDLKDADVICDLNGRWDFEDGSVGVVRACDIIEHLRDPIHTMKELWRVLAPGGYAFIKVPSTDGRGAFQDPTHVSFWNENSFMYYTNKEWAKYIDTPVRFQAMRLLSSEPDMNKIVWTRAHLLKLDGQRVPGLVLI